MQQPDLLQTFMRPLMLMTNLLSAKSQPKRWLFSFFMTGVLAVCSGLLVNQHSHANDLADLFGGASSSQESEFLSVDEAFSVVPLQSAKQGEKGQTQNKITVNFDIIPEHYVYKDKIKLKLPAGVTATPFTFNQTPKTIDDPLFGNVEIFDGAQLTATATLTNTTATAIKESVSLNWQGCAKAGLCYPPESERFTVTLPSAQALNTSPANQKTNRSKEEAKDSQQQPQKVATTQTANAKNTNAKNTKDATGEANAKAQASNKDKSNKANESSQANDLSNRASTTNKQTDNSAATPAKSEPNPPPQAGLPEGLNTQVAPNETRVNTPSNDNTEVDELQTNADASTHANQDGIMAQSDTVQFASSDAVSAKNANKSATIGSITAGNSESIETSTQEAFAGADKNSDVDPFGLASHPALAILLLFVAGFGLSFTACVLPMLPIISNIVARQHNPTTAKSVLLSLGYAVGVATAYGLLGTIIAVFGKSLGIIGWLQNPIILIAFAVAFALLALYMLGVFNLRLPTKLRNTLQQTSQKGDKYLGSVWGSAIAGFLSALVVSPCVSAPLTGALVAVSTVGNPLLGFVALFALGMGLSTTLIVVGATQGSVMPKAGAWMDWVKQGFALLLFAVSLLLVERVLISPWMLMLWAVWFMVVAVWAFGWQGKGKLFSQAVAGVMAVWAGCLLVGAAMGSTDNWQPLKVMTEHQTSMTVAPSPTTGTSPDIVDANVDVNKVNDQKVNNQKINIMTVTSLDDLKPIIANHDKVLVDVTADWCIECRIMDKALFATPPSELTGWQVVKLDITDTTQDSKAVLETFSLFGPPALLYFKNQQFVTKQVGETDRATFVATLNELNKPQINN